MIDIIKRKYSKQAVIYGNIWMYFIDTAKDVINDCRECNLRVYSLEAFKLFGEGIQPSMEHTLDIPSSENSWETAMEFLSNISDTTYLYEIWYEGY